MKELEDQLTRYYQEQNLASTSLESILLESAQYRNTPPLRSWAHLRTFIWPAISCAAMLVLSVFTYRFYTTTHNHIDSLATVQNNSGLLQSTISADADIRLPIPVLPIPVDELKKLPIASKSTLSAWDPTANIVMQESALNHQSKLRLDFETRDFEVLAAAMEQLDFDLTLPAHLAELTQQQILKTLGGRYCTVAGNLAAHVKFTDNGEQAPGPAGLVTKNHRDISLFITPAKPALMKTAGLNKHFDDNTEVYSWHEKGLLYLLVAASSDMNDLEFSQLANTSIIQ